MNTASNLTSYDKLHFLQKEIEMSKICKNKKLGEKNNDS